DLRLLDALAFEDGAGDFTHAAAVNRHALLWTGDRYLHPLIMETQAHGWQSVGRSASRGPTHRARPGGNKGRGPLRSVDDSRLPAIVNLDARCQHHPLLPQHLARQRIVVIGAAARRRILK